MVNLHTNKWKDFGEDSSGGVETWSCVWNGAIFTSACGGLKKATCPAPSDPLLVPTSAGDAGTSPRLTVDNINP